MIKNHCLYPLLPLEKIRPGTTQKSPKTFALTIHI